MSDPNVPNPNQPPQGAPVPPQAPAYSAAPAPGAQAPLNVLALVSFIGSFFISLVGIICGHIALSQIKKTGERGRGFALAGVIIGYAAVALTIIFVIIGIASAMTLSAELSNLESLESY